MDKYLFLGKALKKLRLKKIGLSINCIFFRKTQSIDNPERKLENIYPDNGTSCITQNIVEEKPIYDVQIIMPVYNTAKTLRQAIMSVISQKGVKFHLIIVNDGSDDNSTEILKNYSDNQDITIINQENKGFSGARNTALKHINAKYITFIDSDDYLTDNALRILFEKAEATNSDIIQGSYIIINKNKERKISLPDRESNGIMLGFPWGKLIRSEIFKNIEFPEGYWFEDTLMSVMLFPLIQENKKASISMPVYCYRDNPDGISKTARHNIKIIDTIWVSRRLYLDREIMGLPMRQQEYDQFLKQIMTNIIRIESYGDQNLTNLAIAVMKLFKESFFFEYETTNPELYPIHKALINDQGNRIKFLCGLLN